MSSSRVEVVGAVVIDGISPNSTSGNNVALAGVFAVGKAQLFARFDVPQQLEEDCFAFDHLPDVWLRGVIGECGNSAGDEQVIAGAKLLLVREGGVAVGRRITRDQHADHLQPIPGLQRYASKQPSPGAGNR